MIRKIAILSCILAAQICLAQAPAGAPAGSTGLCNDGTYSKASTKIGACVGHKGVKTWWGATKSSTSSSTTKPSKSSSTTKPSTTTSTKTTTMTPSTGAKTSSTAAAPAPAATPAATPAPSKTATPPSSSSSSKTATAAPGGGPGLVWLNTASNVYHCYGTQYYGKTKAGSYMSEPDAKAKGAHPVGGKPCSAK
ncbi:MAG: signal peptide protein [Terracidiphilus sp.]